MLHDSSDKLKVTLDYTPQIKKIYNIEMNIICFLIFVLYLSSDRTQGHIEVGPWEGKYYYYQTHIYC